MTLFFDEPTVIGGKGKWNNNPFRFYDNGEPWILGGGKVEPTWKDVILSGNTALTLVNAKAKSLEYLKLFGDTEQRNLPSGYTQIEYLESSGTQYIDTGYKPNANTAISIKYYPAVSSTFMCLYGTQDTTMTNRFYGLISSTQFRIQINSNAGQPPNFWGINKDGTLIADVNGTFAQTQGIVTLGVDNKNKIVSIKSDEYTGNISASGTVLGDNLNCSYNLLLLSRGTAGTAANNFLGRLYSFAIKENGTLIQNLIPCRRNSDNVLGMYDTVSQTFLTNAGTGTFTAGADAPTPDAPMDIVCNNGVVKVNRNLYWTEYNGYQLSQVDGVTPSTNASVNVSGMVDCRTIKSFKITTTSPQGSLRIFKYRADNTFINANSTANIGDIVTLEDNVGFFRIQYNFSNIGVGTQNILIYDITYGLNEIYTDGTTETVEITGKNLFDKDTMLLSGSVNINTSYIISNTSNNDKTLVVAVRPNTTYSIFRDLGTSLQRFRVAEFNTDTKPTVGSRGSAVTTTTFSGGATFTTGVNTKWVGIWFASSAAGATTEEIQHAIDTCQLELGSTATTYEPYTVLGTATAENLFKVGTYQDVQSVIDGGVTRNVGVLVLDGTESWVSASVSNLYYFTSSNIKYNATYPALCSHYSCELPSVTGANMGDKKVKVGYTASGTHDRVYIKDSSFANVSSLTTWLATQYANGTPVIIVYPLATATTETVTPQPMNIQAGTNIVEITQASMDDLELEVKYKAGVSVTITEIQNAQLDNNVEVTING